MDYFPSTFFSLVCSHSGASCRAELGEGVLLRSGLLSLNQSHSLCRASLYLPLITCRPYQFSWCWALREGQGGLGIMISHMHVQSSLGKLVEQDPRSISWEFRMNISTLHLAQPPMMRTEDLCRAVVHGGWDFSSVLHEDGPQNFNSVVKSSMGALVVIFSAWKGKRKQLTSGKSFTRASD